MSYLDEWQGEGLNNAFVSLAKSQISYHFWQWYVNNKNDILFRILFWTYRVRDLRWLFVKLFGEP